jgi:CheY-like chemotaxis protein
MNQTERVNVLLVEDDLAHSKIMRRALRGVTSRINLFHVTDGNSAMNFIRGGTSAECSEPVTTDLVLLDLRMPSMDGFAVLSALKGDPALRDVPVVVISTSDRPEDVRRCYSLGANAYVTKPIDYREFTRCVESIATFWLDCAMLPRLAQRMTRVS